MVHFLHHVLQIKLNMILFYLHVVQLYVKWTGSTGEDQRFNGLFILPSLGGKKLSYFDGPT